MEDLPIEFLKLDLRMFKELRKQKFNITQCLILQHIKYRCSASQGRCTDSKEFMAKMWNMSRQNLTEKVLKPLREAGYITDGGSYRKRKVILLTDKGKALFSSKTHDN